MGRGARTEWISGLQVEGEMKSLLRPAASKYSVVFICFHVLLAVCCRSKGGRIHLSWIQSAGVDQKCDKCSEDMPEKHFLIETATLSGL